MNWDIYPGKTCCDLLDQCRTQKRSYGYLQVMVSTLYQDKLEDLPFGNLDAVTGRQGDIENPSLMVLGEGLADRW